MSATSNAKESLSTKTTIEAYHPEEARVSNSFNGIPMVLGGSRVEQTLKRRQSQGRKKKNKRRKRDKFLNYMILSAIHNRKV